MLLLLPVKLTTEAMKEVPFLFFLKNETFDVFHKTSVMCWGKADCVG